MDPVVVAAITASAAGAVAGLFGSLWRKEKRWRLQAERRFEADRASLAEHYDHLTRHASDAILLFDQNLRVMDANEAALRLYGYSLDKFREVTMMDLCPAKERGTVQSTVQWVNEVGSSRYETVHVNAKGQTFPVEATLRALDLPGGRAYQNIVRDISERKAHQRAVERSNVVYSFLAKANQSLLRVSEERQLFQRICHLAITAGGYTTAAVYVCEGNTATIVAEEGMGPELAARLELDLTSPMTRQTAVATAIRENRIQVANHYDPGVIRGLREVPGRAITYGSAAVCPLRRGGAVIGALSLEVASAGFFTSEESTLIEMLAADVSNKLDLLAAQCEVTAAQNRMRQLFTAIEHSPMSVVITNTSGVIEYANPKFVDVTGYSLDEVIGQNPRMLKSGEKSPEEYAHLWQTISAGRIWRGEFHNRRKNGQLYWELATIAPVRDENGKIVRFVAVKEDITELKAQRERAEQGVRKLAAAEQEFRSLFEDAPVAYHEIDANGILLRVNRAACDLLGRKASELVGQPVWTLLHRDEQARSREAIAQKLAEVVPLEPFTREFCRIDGSVFTCEIHDRLVRDGAGQAIGIRSALLDVTSRIRAEQERAVALEQAQEANRAKNRFLAIVSHELRTPLNGIIGITELMLSSPGTEEWREDLRQVHKCALRLFELIKQILDFTDSESLSSQTDAFGVAGLIDELWSAIAPAAQGKSLKMVSRISPHIPETIVADRQRLELVLRALLDNAVKFTSAGEIGLSVDLDGTDQHRLLLRVWDTGIGIPKELRKRVFQPFFQTDMTNTRMHGGIGLGLAITARVLESIGGHIWIDGQGSETGTAIQFTFPIASIPPRASAS